MTLDLTGYAADGGCGVSTQNQVLVSPLTYLLGYKSDGDLNYIQQNSQSQLHLIAHAPDLNRINLDNLTLKLIKLMPINTLVKKKDGSFRYQMLIQQLPVKAENFSVSANGSDYLLPTADMGDFKIIISDKNNTALTQINFSVIGASQMPMEKMQN